MHMPPVSRTVKMKYIVDIGLLISFLACFATGILKLPGFIQFFHRLSFSLPMDQLTVLHDRSGVLLGLFAVIHLYLNWKWLVSVTRKIVGK